MFLCFCIYFSKLFILLLTSVLKVTVAVEPKKLSVPLNRMRPNKKRGRKEDTKLNMRMDCKILKGHINMEI